MVKVNGYGIRGRLLQWIEAFLTGRSQYVNINGEKSSFKNVSSGVPQGSVLGPTLFVIYINDLPDCVRSTVKLYADDAKLYRPVPTKEDAAQLQQEINSLIEWSSKWLLKFHPEKCTVLRIGKKTAPLWQYEMETESGTVALKREASTKDLGIVIDSQLTFDEEVATRARKANNVMGILRRSFTHLNEEMFLLLFKAMVRPHLEYAVAAWAPHLRRHIDKLESVQRRATKQVPGLGTLSYQERLKKLNLPSLEFRRMRGDIIEVFKILSGKYDINYQDFFQLQQAPHNTRGHTKKVTKPSINSNTI